MCASPLSPRHAQPDWMGGGLVSRQMMHAPPVGRHFSVPGESCLADRAGRRGESPSLGPQEPGTESRSQDLSLPMVAKQMAD